VSIKYSKRLAEAGVEPSVGSVGDSYDNALAESTGSTIDGFWNPHRQHSASRSRGAVLRHAGRASHGRI